MGEPLPICYLNGDFLPLREARIDVVEVPGKQGEPDASVGDVGDRDHEVPIVEIVLIWGVDRDEGAGLLPRVRLLRDDA